MGIPCDFKLDHLINQLKVEPMTEETVFPSDKEVNQAMHNSYALVLKKKNTESEGSRLLAIKMSAEGSYRALQHRHVERYWFFDDQVIDTLVFALADACIHVPLFEANRILKRFSIPEATVERVVLSALNEFSGKYKVNMFKKGFSVTYKDYKDIEVERLGSPIEILTDIRLDAVEALHFKEAYEGDVVIELTEEDLLNDSLPDIMSGKNVVPFVENMVG